MAFENAIELIEQSPVKTRVALFAGSVLLVTVASLYGVIHSSNKYDEPKTAQGVFESQYGKCLHDTYYDVENSKAIVSTSSDLNGYKLSITPILREDAPNLEFKSEPDQSIARLDFQAASVYTKNYVDKFCQG